MRRIVIIGGGIAGLATAYFLRDQAEVIVLESGSRVGGKLVTEERQGFLLEGGPDAFVAYKPAALELCRELGLEPIPTLPTRKRGQIVHRGRLRPVPDGLVGVIPTRWLPMALTPLLSLRAKLRMLADLVLPRGPLEDESLGAFLTRRLGRELVERLADPLLGSIYGAPADHLSARCLFPRLLALEEKHRSLILGILSQPSNGPGGPAMWSLPAGMAALPAALESRLGGRIRLNQEVRRVESGRVVLRHGSLEADAVILATPADVTARLLGAGPAAEALAAIRYQRVATVGLAFPRDRVRHPLDGHGFVAPDGACTWASSKFPGRAPGGAVLLRAYLRDPGPCDEVATRTATERLRPLLGLEGAPLFSRLHRWENPVYRVGHQDLVDRAERALPPGLLLTGSAYRGVGVPDCIEQARRTAELLRHPGPPALTVISPVGDRALA